MGVLAVCEFDVGSMLVLFTGFSTWVLEFLECFP